MRWLMGIVFTVTPALFLHLAYDAGRTGVFWLSCGITSLLALISEKLPYILKQISVMILSIIALLSYEEPVLLLIPFLAVAMDRHAPEQGLLLGLNNVLLMGLATIAVEHFGMFEEISRVVSDRPAFTASGLGGPLSIVLMGDLAHGNMNSSPGSRFNWFGNNPLIAFIFCSGHAFCS